MTGTAAKGAIDLLVLRGSQRGFLTMGEVQQELEDAKAPADSFEHVLDALKASEIRIEEDGP